MKCKIQTDLTKSSTVSPKLMNKKHGIFIEHPFKMLIRKQRQFSLIVMCWEFNCCKKAWVFMLTKPHFINVFS